MTCQSPKNCPIYLQSDCVYYSGKNTTYDNLGVILCRGTNLSDIITNIYSFLDTEDVQCTTKVTVDDTVCGYLADKITSTDTTVTITTVTAGDGSQTLDLSTNLSNVLYNNNTQVSRTTTGDFFSYTLPASTLSTNGDQLEIDTYFEVNTATPTTTVNLYFDTVTVNQTIINTTLGNVKYIKILATLNRVSNVQVSVEARIALMDTNFYEIPSAIKYYYVLSGAVNLSNPNIIRTNLSAINSGTIKNDNLTVKLFKI